MTTKAFETQEEAMKHIKENYAPGEDLAKFAIIHVNVIIEDANDS
ncbi:MAG: hypothetical protein AAFM92_04480 [Pseudomonadota bacterium]